MKKNIYLLLALCCSVGMQAAAVDQRDNVLIRNDGPEAVSVSYTYASAQTTARKGPAAPMMTASKKQKTISLKTGQRLVLGNIDQISGLSFKSGEGPRAKRHRIGLREIRSKYASELANDPNFRVLITLSKDGYGTEVLSPSVD